MRSYKAIQFNPKRAHGTDRIRPGFQKNLLTRASQLSKSPCKMSRIWLKDSTCSFVSFEHIDFLTCIIFILLQTNMSDNQFGIRMSPSLITSLHRASMPAKTNLPSSSRLSPSSESEKVVAVTERDQHLIDAVRTEEKSIRMAEIKSREKARKHEESLRSKAAIRKAQDQAESLRVKGHRTKIQAPDCYKERMDVIKCYRKSLATDQDSTRQKSNQEVLQCGNIVEEFYKCAQSVQLKWASEEE